ncbi:MAG: bifunctional phosphoribosylaminoimidazolecarboxamide formyltransferase/IMP cyclohydrolase [Ezakiella sp.]|nr:bifunctional phosphoribosylaminoimidazolecarboxamide formyltransferase/IMP cyclohydrolase [Ezakiella sp.]MDD7761105.1 bifunctional phosphoribosylaminoimidazolecarboxamide formyltransferase/IMP cyclohydrolase [Bacillota bacterium]MDY3947394.1 bifunctional phosphoribosylaminoimidazolecarboxamide formyltransferase/IMP cyclohydrolase [Ezakiella sp.]
MSFALFSCYDKEGIEDFAKSLCELGYKILSTGGTLNYLKDKGVEVMDVSEYTEFEECLGGRVKTLHPKIHAGILYRRENTKDVAELLKLGAKPIDIVVNSLYPFVDTYLNTDSDDEIIEKIDIGGPSMIRAAAKNFKYTNIIVDNSDFDLVLSELKENKATTIETRRYLARKAFNLTANYDAWIAKYFNEKDGVDYPDLLTIPFEKVSELRYGENPHQSGMEYKIYNGESGGVGTAKIIQGKKLSFNNLYDASAAVEMVKLFYKKPAVVAVKHTNPCGIGEADTIKEAYLKAYECDTESIFGGIIASNREIDESAAQEMVKLFLEVIIAPSYTSEALEIFSKKKNLRVLELPEITNGSQFGFDYKFIPGTLLVQERDSKEDCKMTVVSKAQPSDKELEDMAFALKAVKFAKSNAVVLAKDGATVGIGLGNVNRFYAVEAALKQAGDKAAGAVLASDGFFPFDDCIRLLAKHGVKAVVEPGGSIKDEDSIKAADELGLSLCFTSVRHFKH